MIQYRLRKAGYLTAYVGKYFYGQRIDVAPRQFDRWAVFSGYRGYRANVDGRMRYGIKRYSTHFADLQARRFLHAFARRRDRKPWFLVIAPFAPHDPYTVEHRYAGSRVPRYREAPSVRNPRIRTKPGWVKRHTVRPAFRRAVRRRQLRTLKSVDDLIGNVFATMRKLGQARNTLAFFISDNGYFWGEHGLIKDGPGTTGKRFPYQEAVRVPLMMRWPGRVAAGRRDSRLVANIDLAPTILDAAGLPGRKRMDGRSLLDRSYARSRLLLEYWRGGPGGRQPPPTWASTVTRHLQYIEYYRPDGKRIFREHYNLRRDPYQRVNVLRDRRPSTAPSRTRLARLSRQLRRDRLCRGTTCP
jgi:arylsulfatase A-like enzyme